MLCVPPPTLGPCRCAAWLRAELPVRPPRGLRQSARKLLSVALARSQKDLSRCGAFQGSSNSFLRKCFSTEPRASICCFSCKTATSGFLTPNLCLKRRSAALTHQRRSCEPELVILSFHRFGRVKKAFVFQDQSAAFDPSASPALAQKKSATVQIADFL